MNDRIMQFRVGVVVLATLIITGLLITLNSPLPLAWIPWLSNTYPINIEMKQAPGIGPNTPVRKNGVLIGRVAAIEDLDDKVLVTVNIDNGKNLYAQFPCHVRSTVLGDSTIEFDSAPLLPGSVPLAPGATVKGEYSPSTLQLFDQLAGKLDTTILSLGHAGDEVAKLADTFNRAFTGPAGEDRIGRLMNQTEAALNTFSSTMQSVDSLFGDEQLRESLKQGFVEMPDAIHEARVTMESVRGVTASAERNLKNLEGLTEPLGESGANVAEAFLGSVASLDRLIEQITLLVDALNNREGTLGELIHSRALYDDLRQLVANTNYVIVRVNEIAARLRPVVEDARVFMDKIAREPGRIVGGALNQGPGIK